MIGPFEDLAAAHAYLRRIRNPERRAQAARDLGVQLPAVGAETGPPKKARASAKKGEGLAYPVPVVVELSPPRRRRGARPAPEPVPPLALLPHEQATQIRLPYPPSVNSIWRSIAVLIQGEPRVRVLLSERGRAYRRQVVDLVAQHGRIPLAQALVVYLHLYPPDRKRRDIDNPIKAVLDALTHAEIWRDDSLVAELHVYRHAPRPGQACADVLIRARPLEAPPACPNLGDELALDQCRRGGL